MLSRPEAHEGPAGAELTRAEAAAAVERAAIVGDEASAEPLEVRPVTLWRLFQVFFVLGITSFGGGVVAYLRQALVVKQRWMDDETFLSGLELSQTLPGLNATNMSIYMGERLRGVPGAIVALLGMCLPGTVIVMALGMLYASQARTPAMVMVLGGVGAAAVGLTLATTLQIGKKQLAKPLDLSLVALTFVVIGVFRVSLVTALLTIGPLSIWLYRPRKRAAVDGPAGAAK
ncbi:chromate transporter [Candidatus Binatia bacterium]|nr:chromate transporter [Candidatus Binatia bacterium]